MNLYQILEDDIVQLIPLDKFHLNALWEVAKQLDIHMYGPSDISTKEKLNNYIDKALQLRDDQIAAPYAILDKRSRTIVGSTRYGHIDDHNKVLHIGWTWIAREVQGSGLNAHMKYLMLNHAFKQAGFEKVEFRIDERNIRSRKAVEKLGAILEGILRENTFVKNGFKRSSCCYGILKREWEART